MKLFSISKIRNRLREITTPYPRIRGECTLCGRCCKSLILTYRKRVVINEKQYQKLLRWDHQVYSRFIPDSHQEPDTAMRFTCIHQDETNRCTVHKSRPDICRTYPHPSIFKLGAELEDGCGYRLITKGCFEDILEQKKGNNSVPYSSHRVTPINRLRE